MHDHGSAQNRVGSAQGQKFVVNVDVGHAVIVGANVAQIPGVPLTLGVPRGPVLALVQVEMGPGGSAAVGRVAELVNVETVITGLQVGHHTLDVDGVALLINLNK